MLGFLLLLVIVTLAIWTAAAHIYRARIRTWADQVIAGSQQTNATELNKYITRLTTTNACLISRGEQDRQRIDRLRNIRNALIFKHN